MWSLPSAGMPASMVVKMHSTAKNFQSASNDVMVANSEATPEGNPSGELGRQRSFEILQRSCCGPSSTDSNRSIRHTPLTLFSVNWGSPFFAQAQPQACITATEMECFTYFF